MCQPPPRQVGRFELPPLERVTDVHLPTHMAALRRNGGEDEEVAIEAGQLCGMATHPMEPHGRLPTKCPEGTCKLVNGDGVLLPLETLLGPPALVHEGEGRKQAP